LIDRLAGSRWADDFTASVTGSIDTLCWYPCVYCPDCNDGSGGDCGVQNPDQFEVTFYEDAGGLPGAVHAATQLLTFINGNNISGTRCYQFHGSLAAPVPVTLGECYWIEITGLGHHVPAPLGPGTCQVYWRQSSDGNGYSVHDTNASYGFEDVETPEDLAFCVDLGIEAGGCGTISGACCSCGTCTEAVTATDCLVGGGIFHPGSLCAQVTCPGGDDCTTATEISHGPACGDTLDVYFSTGCATDSGPSPVPDCPGSIPVGSDIWFRYTANCTGTLTATLCGQAEYDAVLLAYSDTCPPTEAEQITCDDDGCGFGGGPSEISFPIVLGGVYYLRLGGFSGDSGTGTLSLTVDQAPGACCDEDSFVCTEAVAQAACQGAGDRFGGGGTTCATIDPPCASPRLYVDADATGANDGTSWADAYNSVQDALGDAAGSGGVVDEIWVAGGTYRPDQGVQQTPGDRTATFQLLNGVAIIGGFAGGETMLSQRDVAANPAILSGDLAGNDTSLACSSDCGSSSGLCVNGSCTIKGNRTENSHHVVTGTGVGATAILDGFTITAGNADAGFPDSNGAGMVNRGNFDGSASPTIGNCTFARNRAASAGGGMFNEDGSSPTLTNCTFYGNSSNSGGGGMLNSDFSHPALTNCKFSLNRAGGGGGMSNGSSDPTLTNCTFVGNHSAVYGGALLNGNSSPALTNCSCFKNTADSPGGGGISAQNFGSSDPVVTNSVFWNNISDLNGNEGGPFMDEEAQIDHAFGAPEVNYSIVQGGWTGAGGTGNSASDPLFVDADGADNLVGTEDDDLRLLAGSPAIDAGNNAAVPADAADLDGDLNTAEPTPLDLDGALRFVDDPGTADTGAGTPPIVDRGAYELNPPVLPVFVDASATGAADGTTWTDAYTTLQDAFGDSRIIAEIADQIWVAAGTYTPDQGGGQTPGDRGATFQLLNGAAVYGGFAGGESELSQRDVVANETILSGDLNGDDTKVPCTANSPDCDSLGNLCVNGFCIISDNNDENSHHVVHGGGSGSSAVLDGFTIASGNANGSSFPDEQGGGMLNLAGSGPTVTNCTFSGNSGEYGGGMMNNGLCNPTVTNSTFSGNSSNQGGGGMFNQDGSSPKVTNCTFSGNSAEYGGGMFNIGLCNPTVTNCLFSGNYSPVAGGMYNDDSSPTVTNCAFIGNMAGDIGGGMVNVNGGSPMLANCTFANNSAVITGGGIQNTSGPNSPVITNSIFWNNSDAGGTDESAQIHTFSGTPVVSYSIVQGGWTGAGGTGNSASNPLFVDADGANNVAGTEDDDLRLSPGSPAIDAGDSTALPPDFLDLDGDGNTSEPIPIDLAGDPRQSNDQGTSDTGIADQSGIVVDMGAYEFFPDCNFNGVPDSVDVLNQTSADVDQNGVPDECGTFTGDCANDNWSCVDNWDLPGDVYPDDVASAPGVYVTVDEPADVFFDVDGTMPAMRIRGAKLRVTQTGIGDLTINSNRGLTVGGALRTLHDRRIEVQGPLELDPNGSYARDIGNSICNSPVFQPDCGAAYGYKFNGNTWDEQAPKLAAADAAGGEQFGGSVAVDGDVAVVGVPNDECPAGPICGSAYVYRFNGSAWVEEAKLTLSDAIPGDIFGYSVSISGNVVVVGTYSRRAYVFVEPAGGWVDMTETARLVAMDGASNDQFGSSVSVSGYVAVVGSPRDDCANGALDCGSAYAFRSYDEGSHWFQNGKLTAMDAAEEDTFGYAVSVSGDVAVVGAYGDDCANGDADCGSAYVFRFNGSNWVQAGKLSASDAAQRDYLGRSVSIGADTIVLGASGAGCCGSAYVFTKPGLSWTNMTQTARLTASDPSSGANLGWSIALSGDRVVVGRTYDSCPSGAYCGAAYVFDKPAGGWTDTIETVKLIASDRSAQDDFGSSVSVSGDKVLVGAVYDDCAVGFTDSGACSSVLTDTLTLDSGLDSGGQCGNGGSVELTDWMSVVVIGGLVLNGPDEPGCPGARAQAAGVTPTPKVSLGGNALLTVGGSYTLTGASESSNASTVGAFLAGDWDNRSMAPSLFDWTSGKLILEGTTPQTFEVAGDDWGATTAGFAPPGEGHSNFSIGRLEIAAGAEVRFVDDTDNDGQGQRAVAEALYVRELVFRPGAGVTVDNTRVYYETLVDNGVTATLEGSGVLAQIVAPVAPPLAAPYPHDRLKNRCISFDPNKAENGTANVAFKIDLISIQQGSCSGVDSAPCRYVQGTGQNELGNADCRRCPNNAPCIGSAIDCAGAACNLSGETCANDDPAVGGTNIGMVRWAGTPLATGIFRADAVATFQTGASWPDVIHVCDCEIVPQAIYRITTVLQGTLDESTTMNVSTTPRPANGVFAWWGDAVSNKEKYCNTGTHPSGTTCVTDGDCGGAPGSCVDGWGPPNGFTNFDDINAALSVFQAFGPNPVSPVDPGPKANPQVADITWTDMHDREPNSVSNAADVQFIGLAFQGRPYPFPDPVDCP